MVDSMEGLLKEVTITASLEARGVLYSSNVRGPTVAYSPSEDSSSATAQHERAWYDLHLGCGI